MPRARNVQYRFVSDLVRFIVVPGRRSIANFMPGAASPSFVGSHAFWPYRILNFSLPRTLSISYTKATRRAIDRPVVPSLCSAAWHGKHAAFLTRARRLFVMLVRDALVGNTKEWLTVNVLIFKLEVIAQGRGDNS